MEKNTPPTPARVPAYENEMCRSVGLRMSCNACDRIIFEDEHAELVYKKSGGYCPQCYGEAIRENNEANRPTYSTVYSCPACKECQARKEAGNE